MNPLVNRRLLPTALALLGSVLPLLAAAPVHAEAGEGLTVLHQFGDGSITNDGIHPKAGLVLGIDGNYYGTTYSGGAANEGTVFAVSPTGAYTLLHSFGDGSVAQDGEFPNAPLVEGSDGNFYGTTDGDMTTGAGQTVFRITSAGAVTILHRFGDGSVRFDGLPPFSGLIQANDGNFYGTANKGGSTNFGIVYKINPLGHMRALWTFQSQGKIKGDGRYPMGGVMQASDGNLYGTTEAGGPGGFGNIYRLSLLGHMKPLHAFKGEPVDGQEPTAGLVETSDGFLYGTTPFGGSTNSGILFKMNALGHVTILHNFHNGNVPNDGFLPNAPLIVGSDNALYGTTESGGSPASGGEVFRYIPATKIYAILHAFSDAGADEAGDSFFSGLALGPDGSLFGTDYQGGTGRGGTAFHMFPVAKIEAAQLILSQTTSPGSNFIYAIGLLNAAVTGPSPITVKFTSSDPSVAAFLSSSTTVDKPEDATQEMFIETFTVSTPTVVTLTATAGGKTVKAKLTVTP